MLNPVTIVNGHSISSNGQHAYGNGSINGYAHTKDLTVAKPAAKLAIKTAVRAILDDVGEDSDRDGLAGTPDRIYGQGRRSYRGQDLTLARPFRSS